MYLRSVMRMVGRVREMVNIQSIRDEWSMSVKDKIMKDANLLGSFSTDLLSKRVDKSFLSLFLNNKSTCL